MKRAALISALRLAVSSASAQVATSSRLYVVIQTG